MLNRYRNKFWTGISFPSLLFFILSAVLYPAAELAQSSGTSYLEDINGDGSANISDVLFLLLLARECPDDPRADFNGDGEYSITDAVSLLISIRTGSLTPLTGSAPSLGEMEVYPTWNAVGLEIPYSGVWNSSTQALLFWRKNGNAVWRNGVEMTVDQDRCIVWASIFPLNPGDNILVRVLLHDRFAPGIPPIEQEAGTRKMILESSGGQTYYVSPEGEDQGLGTREQPFRTLARAGRIARPGDIVYALDGVYREGDLLQNLKGTENQPIVFSQAPGHKPILDSSFEIPKGSGAWKQSSGQVYVTTLSASQAGPAAVAGYGYVAQDGRRIFPYSSFSDFLTNLLSSPNSWFFDPNAGKLYIRTGSDDSPENHTYRIAQHRYAFFLTSSEYIVVQGFEMRFYGQAGVRLSEGAHGCVIYENIIHNAPNGVYLKNAETRDNAVWHNTIFESGLVEIPWNSIKAGEYPRQGVMSWVAGRGNSFNYNIIHGWFDGITVESWQMPERIDVHRDTDIMYNQVYNIGDDAFETDGGGVNMRLHGNSVRNALVAISLAPVERGPVYITRNEVTFMNMMFKFNVGSPWSSGWTYLYHNSGYGLNNGNGMAMIGLTGTASGGPDCRNKIFKNNAMIGADRAVRTGYDGNNHLDYDSYYHIPGLSPRKFEWNGVTYQTFEEFRKATGQEAHGLYADPQFVDTPGLGQIPWQGFWADQIGNYPLVESARVGDLHLEPSSPDVDRGAVIRGINEDYFGSAPDIGAFEHRP